MRMTDRKSLVKQADARKSLIVVIVLLLLLLLFRCFCRCNQRSIAVAVAADRSTILVVAAVAILLLLDKSIDPADQFSSLLRRQPINANRLSMPLLPPL